MKPFEYIGCGRQREVWRHGNYVIKIPLNQRGVEDNWHEANIWRRYGRTPTYIQYARCRLLHNFILVMEYARYIGPTSDETGYIELQNCPKWAHTVDCWQVGYNKNGKIVAYDYGIN